MEPDNPLQRALAACQTAGDACLAHCLRLLGSGDTSMAACAKAVVVMLPTCEAMGTLVENQSERLPALAAVCADLCRDCAAACEPHAGHHAECADCLAACRGVIAAVAAL